MRPRETGPRPPWTWAAAGLASGLVLGTLLFAPARWVAGAVAGATDGQVRLDEPRGTVWNGSARLVLTGGPGSSTAAALPGRVGWRLRPRLDGASIALDADCCTPRPLQVRAHVGWQALRLDFADGDSRWPASLATGLGTPWNTLQLEGELRLATRGLSVEWTAGRPAVAGQAELVASDVSSRLSTLRPMGSYRITVQGGATPGLRVETLAGPLRLAGSGQWVGRRLRFRGEASAAPEREAALANLLNIIGRRSGARSLITIG